jgi:hypothetical protein
MQLHKRFIHDVACLLLVVIVQVHEASLHVCDLLDTRLKSLPYTTYTTTATIHHIHHNTKNTNHTWITIKTTKHNYTSCNTIIVRNSKHLLVYQCRGSVAGACFRPTRRPLPRTNSRPCNRRAQYPPPKWSQKEREMSGFSISTQLTDEC